MTSLERYMRMVKGQQPDFVPRIPIVMQYAAEYIGSNYGAFASDYNVLVEANRRCAEDFGFDQLSAISDPYRETQGFGGNVTYIPDGVPRCTNPLLATKDLSVLSHPDPAASTRMLDRVNAIRTYKAQFGGRYSIMGWVEGPAAEAADLRGVTNFLMDTIDDPDFLCDLMDRCVDGWDGIRAGATSCGSGHDRHRRCHRKPAFTGVLSLVYSTPGKDPRQVYSASRRTCPTAYLRKHHPPPPRHRRPGRRHSRRRPYGRHGAGASDGWDRRRDQRQH